MAEPGFAGVAPGIGEIIIAPVSVCHQVSTIGQRFLPIASKYHFHAAGLIDSPTVPSSLRLLRSCESIHSVPQAMNARIAVGGAVKNCHFVALHNLPESVSARMIGRAFVHHNRRAVRQRAVNDVAVSRHPADIGGAPVDVFVPQIENHLRGPHRLQQVAGRSVQHALGFSRGAAGIQNVERMLGIEGCRDAFGRSCFFKIVPPKIATLLPADFLPGALYYD